MPALTRRHTRILILILLALAFLAWRSTPAPPHPTGRAAGDTWRRRDCGDFETKNQPDCLPDPEVRR